MEGAVGMALEKQGPHARESVDRLRPDARQTDAEVCVGVSKTGEVQADTTDEKNTAASEVWEQR